jgi:hypothetical protein
MFLLQVVAATDRHEPCTPVQYQRKRAEARELLILIYECFTKGFIGEVAAERCGLKARKMVLAVAQSDVRHAVTWKLSV